MKNLVFYRDRSETFKCSVLIEGASEDNSFARLCLEFADGKNMYFNGKIKEGGVLINIPALKGVNLDEGTAVLEVVAEGTYFKPFSSTFKLTEAVKVTMAEPEVSSVTEQAQHRPKITVKFDDEIEDLNEEEIKSVIKPTPRKTNHEQPKDGFKAFEEFLK